MESLNGRNTMHCRWIVEWIMVVLKQGAVLPKDLSSKVRQNRPKKERQKHSNLPIFVGVKKHSKVPI